MAQLILNSTSPYHRALRTGAAFPLTMRVGKFFLFFSMTLFIGLLSFFYLLKFTEVQAKGNSLQKLEQSRDRLMTNRESQSMSIFHMKSLNAVRDSETVRRMVPLRSAVFIKEDGSVAQVSNLSGG